MKNAHQLAIETAIMTDDMAQELKLKDVKISGECVITVESLTFYKTLVTDENDRTEVFWIARHGEGDDDFLLEDDQPEGIHIPAKVL